MGAAVAVAIAKVGEPGAIAKAGEEVVSTNNSSNVLMIINQ